jgi:hypothetical protein
MSNGKDLVLVTAGSSGRQAARMPEGRRLELGRSGNPYARPKPDLDAASLAREHTVAAIATLATIMQDTVVPASARVSAATALLDRGYGRAPQSLDVSQRLTLSEEFEVFVRELQIARPAASAVLSGSE